MTLPGEAIPVEECEDCGTQLPIEVLRSPAGYYIGQWCSQCGPYSRLSTYYRQRANAETALREDNYGR
jgi:hypothetical protein